VATFAAIRDAVKSIVEANITALKVHPRIPGEVTGHCMVVQPAPGTDFEVAMGRGLDMWQINLAIIVPLADLVVAQKHLDGYVDGGGSLSVRKVIFDNKTLGLADTNAHVSGITAYGPNPAIAFDHLGAVLRMVVHTKPS
jgi:hypothetical protein